MTPTARTLAWLRAQGYACAVVERFIPRVKRRVDLFGFIDIVAIRPGDVVAVQSTVDGRRADHRDKILAEPNAALWTAAGGRVLLVTWGKHGPRGGRKVWAPHVEEILVPLASHGDNTTEACAP